VQTATILEYLVRLAQVVEKHLGLLQGFHVFTQIAEHAIAEPPIWDVTQLVFDCLQGITRMKAFSSFNNSGKMVVNQPMVRDRSTSSKTSSVRVLLDPPAFALLSTLQKLAPGCEQYIINLGVISLRNLL